MTTSGGRVNASNVNGGVRARLGALDPDGRMKFDDGERQRVGRVHRRLRRRRRARDGERDAEHELRDDVERSIGSEASASPCGPRGRTEDPAGDRQREYRTAKALALSMRRLVRNFPSSASVSQVDPRRTFVKFSIAFLGVAALGATACSRSGSDDRAFQWSTELPAGAVVHLRNGAGAIEIRRAEGQSVLVNGSRRWNRGRSSDIRFVVSHRGNDYYVCAMWRNSGDCGAKGYRGIKPGFLSMLSLFHRNSDARADFVADVPANVAIDALTTNGSVQVDGISAGVTARTSNGNVRGAQRLRAVDPLDEQRQRATHRRRAARQRSDQCHDQERRDSGRTTRGHGRQLRPVGAEREREDRLSARRHRQAELRQPPAGTDRSVVPVGQDAGAQRIGRRHQPRSPRPATTRAVAAQDPRGGVYIPETSLRS